VLPPQYDSRANGWPEPGFLFGRATLDETVTLRARIPNGQARGVIPLLPNVALANKTRALRDLFALLAR
jgi:hypothetical protein